MTRVKICGLRSAAEVRLAARCGADACGVLVGQVHRSADFVGVAEAAELFAAVPPFLTAVLVTHAASADAIADLCERLRCDVVQLHSDLELGVVAAIRRQLWPRKLIGKISVEDESAVARAGALAAHVDALVLDSIDRAGDRVGGTGQTHDWALSARIVQTVAVPVILAGGLTPSNVRQAIRVVRPWAVDVNSGVKGRDGGKSVRRVQAFVRAAHGGSRC